MNNLIVGLCVYNEEHRFLEQCLKNMKELTDKIVILDDGSTDNSYNISTKYAMDIFQTNRLYTKSEAELRKVLWNRCEKIAKDGDFIYMNDPDEIFTKNSTLHFEEELQKAINLEADGIGIYRYDMWNQNQYRKDSSWNNNEITCIRIAKYKKNFDYKWLNMKLHGGAIPYNAVTSCYLAKLQVQHWAYSTPELRNQKKQYYDNYDPGGIWMPESHYNDILNTNIKLCDFKDFYEENINEYYPQI